MSTKTAELPVKKMSFPVPKQRRNGSYAPVMAHHIIRPNKYNILNKWSYQPKYASKQINMVHKQT